MFGIVRMIMKLAPIGTLGAMAYTIGKYGFGSLVQMAELTVAVWAVSILFVLVIPGGIMKAVDINILKLLRHIREEILITLGTSSSEAVLAPLLVKMERLGCAKPIVGMVMPAGYTFNADGTSIYLGMCAIFIAQATNIPLTLGQQAVILITLMLTSKGSAGVAGAGFVTLAATLASMNQIPVAGIVLLLGVDRFTNAARATTASPRSWWRNGKAPSTKLRPSECWGECVERSAPCALFSYRDRLGRAAGGRIRRVAKAICAKRTAGVDVKHPLRIVALNASIGRKVSLQASPREGPESAPKPPFRCEREIGLAARRRHSASIHHGRIAMSEPRARLASRASGSRSFLSQPRLAQAVEQGWQIRRMVGQPLDREVGIEAASFRQGGLRLIHLACERIGGGQIYVRYKIVGACVDRLLKFVDTGVETPETKFRHTQINEPVGSFRISRTQPHRLLRIGFGLLETTKDNFGESSRVKQRRVVRIDRETSVGGAERFVRAACIGKIEAFGGIRPHVVGSQRYGLRNKQSALSRPASTTAPG
jgi:hypothetical protein